MKDQPNNIVPLINAINPAEPMTVMNGGVELDVQLIDGTKARVKVRQLPLRLINEWFINQADEAKLIELYLGKPAEFVDSIAVEHQELIVEVGEKLNSPTYDRWSARMQAATGRVLRSAEAANEVLKARAQALGTPASTSP